MDAKALLKERTELFDNIYQFKHNKRVPTTSNSSYWAIFDNGYERIDDAVYDYGKMEKVAESFMERYQFDACRTANGGTTSSNYTRDYGPNNFRISDDGSMIVCEDYSVMEREEYAELRESFNIFLWTKNMPRNLKAQITTEGLQSMVEKWLVDTQYGAKIRTMLKEKYGQMLQWKSGINLPMETIISYLRGIKNTSMDLRKCKEELKLTCDSLWEETCLPILKNAVGADYEGCVAPMYTGMLAHSVMNRKQFDELYWPYLKQFIDFCVENNLRMWFFCEAEILRFADYFQEIPKGMAIVQVETDDIFEVRKKIPNVALAGGMPLDLLGYGTSQECVDYAKKLIDTLGDGFVLTQDKMICTKNDAKRENLLAVNEFAHNYQY